MSKVRTHTRIDGSTLNLKTSGRLDINGKKSVKRSVSKHAKTVTRRMQSNGHKSRFEHIFDCYHSLNSGEQIVGIIVYVNQVGYYERLLKDLGLDHVHVIGRYAGEEKLARVVFIVSLRAANYINLEPLLDLLLTNNGFVKVNGSKCETRTGRVSVPKF